MVRNREPGSDLLVADVGGMGIMACRRLGQSTRARWIIAADRRRSRLLCSCPCGQLKSEAVASKLALAPTGNPKRLTATAKQLILAPDPGTRAQQLGAPGLCSTSQTGGAPQL